MGGTGMVELRFSELRERLDLLGYRQPLSLDSLPLAECMLADLLRTTDSLKATKRQLQAADREAAEGRDCVEPYRQDNARLCQELSALHEQLSAAAEKHQADTKDLRADVRRLTDENEDLRFLCGQYRKQADAAEQRLFALLEKQPQPLASVTVTGERPAGSQRGRRQRLDISSHLDSSRPSANSTGRSLTESGRGQADRHTIDLVTAAEQRVADLEQQRDAAEEAREAAEAAAEELRNKVSAREAEISRLNGLLQGGRPQHAVLADSDGKENAPTRSNVPYTELKKANARLEKKLKEAVHTQHEAMQRAVQLAQKNEALKRELDDLDEIVHALDRDRDQAVLSKQQQLQDERSRAEETVQELGAAAARAERQTAELAAARDRLADTESELSAERRRREQIETELAAARQAAASHETVLQTLRADRQEAQRRLDKIAENEKQLVLELDRLSRQKTNKVRMPEKTQKLIDGLEEQRDYFKSQVEELLEQLEKRDVSAASLHAEETAETGMSAMEAAGLRADLGDCRRQLDDCRRELEQCRRQLLCRTDESEQLRRRLDEALCSLHRLSDSQASATMTSTAQLEGLLHTMERTMEQERSLASGDCKRLEHERNELRSRLKVATETQLAERVKQEARIAELEALIGAAETDRTVQRSEAASQRALIVSLEAQMKGLQDTLSESQTELSRVLAKNNKMKTFVSRGESSLKDCENQLIKKTGELEACLQELQAVQRQCADLRRTQEEAQREARRQTKVIEQLVRERDKFQNTVDDKTELLDEHRQQLEKCNAHIVQLESTVTNVAADLATSREQVSELEKELRSVRRKLEAAEAQVGSSDRHRGAVTEENRRLQQDLTTLTRELQQMKKEREEAGRLQEELRQQVREYVNEVARVEELLGIREEERNDLLRQYKNLTVEASGLEETNHTLDSEVTLLRSEVAARDAELEHARETITLLNEDIQQTSVARQQADISASRLNESLSGLEARLQQAEADRDRLDRELAACRDLSCKLDSQRQTLSRELADRDRELERLRSESRTQQTELQTVRQQLTSERATCQNLESLLASSRGQQYESDMTSQQQTAELGRLSERVSALQSELEAQKIETGLYRAQAADKDAELDRYKRQIVSERFEKERLSQELRRLRRETVLSTSAPLLPGTGRSPTGHDLGGSPTGVTTRLFSSTAETSSSFRRHTDGSPSGAG
ncbi:centrosomal protein of 135 kDa-like [Amphibalanus amphitrite]|uniref:centrosomal protein of 135 kDa-like n=1 Tax=Amphibalanus amphitrite TaxID=1232801 RepID=UPI001C902E2B|nr:centrosomal protein of 135 kDa-like [Amphibalanus amphitrite]XP_043226609.1 centrosomal protein of 135 kDa-like [Amphibalanus amphitrite]XP_043226617.1 centrosomal protein of 135 kDa-like [Amphibalanus amphitrite]XP_043226625.1 centrosomal protein of 135 kDa-like [Amphibalanus amphitrite]XP_043226634.1 centrosomal protein of 135 kDa-like [Amphibalanus amphitrite]XP_043226644.1 centrosomal protein of 135 kDa-like [Amphibalanus amphitrite]